MCIRKCFTSLTEALHTILECLFSYETNKKLCDTKYIKYSTITKFIIKQNIPVYSETL